MKAYPSLPNQMVRNVVSAFKHVSDGLNVVPMGGVYVPGYDVVPEAQVLSARINGACNQVGMWYMTYVRSDVRPSTDVHERRDILDVLKCQGGSLVDGQLEWDVPCCKALKQVPVVFLLCGENRFQGASVNSANQAAAMTRVFKARGGSLEADNEYTALQLTFLFDLYPPDSPVFLKQGRAHVRFCGNRYTGTTFYSQLPVRNRPRMDDERHKVIAPWFRTLMSEYLAPVTFFTFLLWLSRMLGCAGVYSHGREIYRDFSTIVCEYGLRLGLLLVSAPMLALWWSFDVITLRYFVGHLPHQKAALRKMLARARYGELRPVEHSCFVDKITAEVKDEFMKPGKPPRLYFSLGLLSSMFGGAYIDIAKKHLAQLVTIMLCGWQLQVQFVSDNSPEFVAKVFNHAFNVMTSGYSQIYGVFMSDDVAVFTPEGAYDLDISMCDASLGLALFWVVWLFLRACCVPEHIIEGVFLQISKTVEIRNPSDKKSFVWWRFITYYLVSGTVLTTLTDSIASLLVICVFVAAYISGVRAPLDFEPWFRAVGLCVTVEHRPNMTDVCLLKRHPMRLETGEWVAPLAFGCLVKRFGILDTDLTRVPGDTLAEKGEAFLGAVVDSWKGEPGHPLLDAFRLQFPPRGHSISPDSRLSSTYNPQRLSVESFCEAYGITADVYFEAVSLIREGQIGSVIQCDLMTAVNRVDYGL